MIDIEAVKAKAKYMRMPLCELAEKIGYSEAGMYRAFSHGKYNVRLIVNISQVLGMELKDFVTDEKTLQSLTSLNKPFAAANEKEGINNYEERMNKSYVERINALTDGLNAYHHQMEIKDGQLQKKDEQIDIFLKVLMQKDELIEELTKQVSSILEQCKIRDEALEEVIHYFKSQGIAAKISKEKK